MTGKLVNLGRARKDRARAERAARGNANAARFGRTKAQRIAEAAAKAKAARELDGKKREE
ncbi:MAG: DUF4169 family protein [Pseudomonadota bacterium]